MTAAQAAIAPACLCALQLASAVRKYLSDGVLVVKAGAGCICKGRGQQADV